MPFNLLLLPLLGGFIFFSHWNRTVFFAKRQDRERLLLYSSLYGLLFLGLSFLLSIIAPYIPLMMDVRLWWAYHTPSIQFSGISSFALLLGVVGQSALNHLYPFNRIWTAQKEGERAIQNHGNELEKLIFRSLVEAKRVMLTLKSGKVYVGRVSKFVGPTVDRERDLILLPSKGGYRDNQHQLVVTTDYDAIYAEIVDTERDYIEISEFGVVIPIAEILSASSYRADEHAKNFSYSNSLDRGKERKPANKHKKHRRSVRATKI